MKYKHAINELYYKIFGNIGLSKKEACDPFYMYPYNKALKKYLEFKNKRVTQKQKNKLIKKYERKIKSAIYYLLGIK